ncbi:hypothetical protein [Novosphingobium sp. PY1]|uniref:hypothetical protein n=1 Tax=Novosphingobium sp. PY1 TaxID=1882221 RepID=UPI001A8CB281|nr:hypothetical protein [Novosphingobium sp. PY1]
MTSEAIRVERSPPESCNRPQPTVGGLVFDTKLLIARPLKMEAMQELAQTRASRKN